MNWLFKRLRILSDKNGTIEAERVFGRWSIIVDGYSQTSEKMGEILRETLVSAKKIKPEIQHVLILGLGAGSVLKHMYEIFPHCRITAVEHDRKMIELVERCKYYKPFPMPDVREGDAGEILRSLPPIYDLIIVDLFTGGTPSPLLSQEWFTKELKLKAPRGIVAINFFKSKELLEAFRASFVCSDIWETRGNVLGIFY